MKWKEFREKFKEEMKDEDLSSALQFTVIGLAHLLTWTICFASEKNLDTTVILIMGLFSITISYHVYARYRLKKIIDLVENMQHHLETLGNQIAEPVKGSGSCKDSAEWEDLYQRNPPN